MLRQEIRVFAAAGVSMLIYLLSFRVRFGGSPLCFIFLYKLRASSFERFNFSSSVFLLRPYPWKKPFFWIWFKTPPL